IVTAHLARKYDSIWPTTYECIKKFVFLFPVFRSWNTYLPSQQTLSDFREMGLPDYPIERCGVHRIPLPPPPNPCQRVVTDGESLLKYYQDYGKKY
ncbi:hypothetical protein, partial [Endozoicomonas sp. YOMI1]|uniref:hypothetical protein n=1 Tax=Endozoicomonas sp. YOMI1 TaxID=2828739 RepID=UPI002148C128